MKTIIFFISIIIFTNNLHSQSLFETDFYEIDFISNNVEDDKIRKISNLKFETIFLILNDVLLNSDYNQIKRNLNEDQINVFIKNLQIEEEKIINNRYKSKIKINYNKKRIIEYLRSNKLNYVEFLPQKVFTIIYEKNNIYKNLFSKNNLHYNFLIDNYKDYKFYNIPNLDINDRYLLKENDIENIDLIKLKKFIDKYKQKEAVLIISENNLKNIDYSIFFYTNDKLTKIREFKKKNYNYSNLFRELKYQIIQHWKKENSINNSLLNSINCEINYFNLRELKQIKTNLSNISSIKDYYLKTISFKKNYYNIYFYGKKKLLPQLFSINKLDIKINDDYCKINLK